MRFGPNQFPRAIFASELASDDIGAIMILDPDGQIIHMTDVKTALGILKNVCPKHAAKKLAPEVGLEPATTRLIPTSRDSTTEQMFANPSGGLHRLDLLFASHC